jgi:hypothetical protein
MWRIVVLAVGSIPFLLAGCSRKPNDQLIVQQVEARLFQDSTLKKCDIHVESANGSVTLTGNVNAEGEKLAAGRLASEVPGVKQVVVSLNVLQVERAPGSDAAPPVAEAPVAPAPQQPASVSPVTPASLKSPIWDDPIDRYLARKPSLKMPSPLAGHGSIFESDGRQYTIDPRLIVAISGAETSFASGKCHKTPIIATRNAWNWFWCYGNGSCGTDVCTNSAFDSWDSGIKTVSKYVKRNYVMKGLTDVRKIQTKYCTEGCDYWVKNVDAFMQEMGGDPENLTVLEPFPAH